MDKRNIEDIYPLSPLQKGLLFHAIQGEASHDYLVQSSYVIEGALDEKSFWKAWKRVQDRHAPLRTSFHWKEHRQPMQVVWKSVDLPWETRDWSGLSEAERAARLEDLMAADREKGHTLDEAPLLRMYLIRRGPASHRLVWSHHHLLLDGWSVMNVLREALQLYDAHRKGQQPPLNPVRPYRDYITWLRQQDEDDARQFWTDELAGVTSPTPVPFDGTGTRSDVPPRSDQRDDASSDPERFAETHFRLSRETSDRLRDQAKAHGLTLNTLVQGAWAVLLSRLSGESDVVFGATVSGRPSEIEDVAAMVGLFINTLPVRVKVNPDEPLREVFRRLQERQARARRHEYASLADVQQWSDVPGGRPLFESLVVFENYATGDVPDQTGLEARRDRSYERTNYPLSLIGVPQEALKLLFAYDTTRIDRAHVERLQTLLQRGLVEIAGGLDATVREVRVLGDEERRRVLGEWSGRDRLHARHEYEAHRHRYEAHRHRGDEGAGETPPPRTLVDAFDAQVQQRPDARAVRGPEGRTLTYADLDDASSALAAQLRQAGVEAESVVGIALDRSLASVVAMLSVCRAGGAYMPLDVDDPIARVRYMIADSGANHVLVATSERETTSERDEAIRASGANVLRMRTDTLRLDGIAAGGVAAGGSAQALETATVNPSQMAYIMYTSGSTGQPKGVMVTHENVLDFTRGANCLDITPEAVVSHHSSLSFDPSVGQVWGALVVGARVEVMSADQIRVSPSERAAVLRRRGCTHGFLTTALFNRMVEAGDTLDFFEAAAFGGEAVTPRWVRKAVSDGGPSRLVHVYGPTEATVVATTKTVTDVAAEDHTVPIGRPLEGSSAYVLDASMQPVPEGVVGELYVGGAGLARGYRGAPRKTASSFVPNPFAERDADAVGLEPGSRLYRTGDRVRWNADGDLVFVGRTDRQVQVRGRRVELDAVEAHLADAPGVGQAAARLWTPPASNGEALSTGREQIVGYITAASEGAADTDALLEGVRAHLRQNVPAQLVPGRIERLDAMPLTSNGKVHYDALPDPTSARPSGVGEYQAPETSVEQTLARIWKEVLGVDRVGVQDNFFDLGGHSLLLIQVQTGIENQLDTEIPIVDLFNHPTIRSLARRVKNDDGATSVETDERMEEVSKGRSRLEKLRNMRG